MFEGTSQLDRLFGERDPWLCTAKGKKKQLFAQQEDSITSSQKGDIVVFVRADASCPPGDPSLGLDCLSTPHRQIKKDCLCWRGLATE